jgi:AcrR family transcriptional regulator
MKMEPRLSSDDWVRVALEALSEGGIDDVRVERLALRLGISKGSFYWHFRKREDLLVRVIEAWEHRQTQTVIERVDSAIAEPLERLELLTILVGRLDVRLEEAMRRWAASDMRARQAVERIDRARLAHIQSLIAAAGVPEMHARVRARLVYYAFIGEVAFGLPVSPDERPLNSAMIQKLILTWP